MSFGSHAEAMLRTQHYDAVEADDYYLQCFIYQLSIQSF